MLQMLLSDDALRLGGAFGHRRVRREVALETLNREFEASVPDSPRESRIPHVVR